MQFILDHSDERVFASQSIYWLYFLATHGASHYRSLNLDNTASVNEFTGGSLGFLLEDFRLSSVAVLLFGNDSNDIG